jgi:hypothetical protein
VHVRPPVEFRVGDRLRLRKVHPCGGWTWRVDRLGADIGLICETCGRRVLLDRPTLERRVKSFLEHGRQPSEVQPARQMPSDAGTSELTCESLGLRVDDVLEASVAREVSLRFFYASRVESGSGRIESGQLVRVGVVHAGATSVLLELLDDGRFERRYVPGGIRSHENYTGFALEVSCSDLARYFRPAAGDCEPIER